MTVAADFPLGPFRDAFRSSDLTFAEVGRRMGVDKTRARALLTGAPRRYYRRRGAKRYGPYIWSQSSCTYEVAVRLCRALDRDPRELGL